MAIELKLPLLGDVMQEGTLVAWLLPNGTQVQQGQPLYHLETDKVSLDVEAPAAGVLQQVAAAGSTVPVGAIVGRLVDPAAQTSAAPQPPTAQPQVVAPLAGRPATPAARRLARELGVDLEAMPWPGGRIREADVQAFYDGQGQSHGQRLSGRRALIAERMVTSLREMAQLTISLEVDISDCARLRNQLAQLWPARPTYTDFVVLATALALREHPALNATLEGGSVEVHQEINIGLAVDVPEGLIVPVIRGVERLNLAEVVAETRRLSERARTNALTLDELQHGTFSVTTLGALGIDFFTPIINPPQVAILGIGRVFARLALRDGQVEERQAMYLNLSFDHRAIDGAPAARFLNRVKELLELPAGLLTQGMKLPPLTSSTAPTQ